MTHPKRLPDPDLMQKAADARMDRMGATDAFMFWWVADIEDFHGGGWGNDSTTRAAILESLAYDGVEVEAPWYWSILPMGTSRVFARKGA